MFVPRSRRAALALAAGSAVVLGSGAGAAIALGPAGEADRSADLHAQIDPSKPRNVILLIGDGTDESIITAARNYELGAAGRWALDDLPFVGDMTVHGLKTGPGPDYPIAYVSDSAPTASAWSTGRKTVDSRVSQGPSESDTVPGTDYETVLEQYEAQGKLTGNVSTSEITDATPAAAGSHINLRACQGPQDMANCSPARKANGGKGSIAEQLVDNEIDVILGGGMNRYTQATDAGPTVREYAEDELGYRTITDKAGLATVDSLEDGPLLGLFAGGNMSPAYAPLVAAPGGVGGPTTRCTPADRGQQPTLAEMTEKAIDLLDNPKGFFLQVESAMVDKQEHASDICGAIGDVKALDEAVKVALDYQKANPDTLIIVTADHSHSTQIVGGLQDGIQTAQLQTADGDPMSVAYSTSPSGSDHTGSTVRVAAKGPQAANVTGLIDQTDLYKTLLGRAPSSLKGNTVTVPGPTQTVTVTVPGPATTVPGRPSTAPSSTPRAAHATIAAQRAIARATLRNKGVAVAVAAIDATGVEVGLFDGRKELASKVLGADGGSARLKPRGKPRKGALELRVTVNGPGGSEPVTRTVRVR